MNTRLFSLFKSFLTMYNKSFLQNVGLTPGNIGFLVFDLLLNA